MDEYFTGAVLQLLARAGHLHTRVPRDLPREFHTLVSACQTEVARITVDLEKQLITRPDGSTVAFDIDPFRKHCLLNGLDDIGITLQKDQAISSFEAKQRTSQPWV